MSTNSFTNLLIQNLLKKYFFSKQIPFLWSYITKEGNRWYISKQISYIVSEIAMKKKEITMCGERLDKGNIDSIFN